MPDKTQIGIYYAKKKPKKLLLHPAADQPDFTIPPNDRELQSARRTFTGRLGPLHL